MILRVNLYIPCTIGLETRKPVNLVKLDQTQTEFTSLTNSLTLCVHLKLFSILSHALCYRPLVANFLKRNIHKHQLRRKDRRKTPWSFREDHWKQHGSRLPAMRDDDTSCHAACIEVVQNPQHQVPTKQIQWVLTKGKASFLSHLLSFSFPFLSHRLHC